MNRRNLILSGIAASLAGATWMTGATATVPSSVRKPKRLSPGDTIGLVAPASPASNDEAVRFSGDLMRSLGFKVKEGEHLYDRDEYLAGRDEDRAHDVNAMFADDGVDAIFAARGGYGTQRILPYLDYDLIASKPKVFAGTSDITGIQIAMFEKAGLVGFHGPAGGGNFTDYSLAEFRKVLMQPSAPIRIGQAPSFEQKPGFIERENRLTHYVGGVAEGRLIGGNLTLVSTLMGTPYEPDFKDRIVFLEDVDEAPYRIDRMLTQLWLAGKLQRAAGIAFGKFTKTEYDSNTFNIEDIIRRRCTPLGIPVVSGLMIGHIEDKTTVPIGIMARLDGDSGSLELLEPAVT